MMRTSIMALSLVFAASQVALAEMDKSRYIGIDEVRPGMEASCLTVFEGTKVESFPLQVVSVVRNISPGRNAILVRGTDERFIHAGPVAGCSGSPVFIDGRMAGALSFAWPLSKDPLYGVTPIEEMLAVGSGKYDDERTGPAKLDMSGPLDLDALWKAAITPPLAAGAPVAGAAWLPIPLAVSLPEPALGGLRQTMEPLGFLPVSGGSRGGSNAEIAELVPGGAMAVPLVTGDITMSAIGTVTDVVDGKFYAFGHSLLGYGKLQLPVGPAYIHTVVASIQRSFKLGDATEVTGTLTRDEQTAVYGILGVTPPMVDMRITVERYNDTEKRLYNCRLAKDDYLTPQLVNSVISGASQAKGELPPENSISYQIRIKPKGLPEIIASNVSTDVGLSDLIRETVAPTNLLINNPYRKVDIESIDVQVTINRKSTAASIRSFDVSRSRLKAGQTLEASASVYSYRTGSRTCTWQVTMPQDVPPGTYKLMVMGPDAYLKFLTQAAPHRFAGGSLDGVLATINNVLGVRRDRIYSVLTLPPGGLTIERNAMPDLPAGKAALLADPGRTFRVQPFQQWSEQQIPFDGIVADARTIDITIEEQ
jgi:hypothetical protein